MSGVGYRIMLDALVAITNVGRGWGTTGDGHARCIQIADKALTEAEHADMEAAYRAATTPAQGLDAATIERMRLIVEVVANADSEDCIGSLDVDIPKNGYPRQWLRDAARAALNTASTTTRGEKNDG